MQGDDPRKNGVTDGGLESKALPDPGSALLRMSRAIPRTDFVRRLGTEIGRTAREKMGYWAGKSFADRVVELRQLVRLLRQTLVPVQPRPAFRSALGEQLSLDAFRVEMERQNRWRWLVIGSALGSVISLLGVLTALLLRQRSTRPNAKKKIVGAT
jgi:hypothetical protein